MEPLCFEREEGLDSGLGHVHDIYTAIYISVKRVFRGGGKLRGSDGRWKCGARLPRGTCSGDRADLTLSISGGM
jgi:hypothetical protein